VGGEGVMKETKERDQGKKREKEKSKKGERNEASMESGKGRDQFQYGIDGE
jgi:hypothetical protein